jgi:integrase
MRDSLRWELLRLPSNGDLAPVPQCKAQSSRANPRSAGILTYDAASRESGRSSRTIANKRQRLQSMLRFAGVDPAIFSPKPKYQKKLPTIYTPAQLAGLFKEATPYETISSHLALKLGLRDQEVQYGEFTDITWDESVFRVRSKPQ